MARSTTDQALLTVARALIGISLRAADRLGGLTIVQLRALTVLQEHGTANLRQLAEGMGITVSTTSRLVDRLEAAGLVERRPSPRTGREIELRTTPDGEAALDRYDELRLADLRGALDRLPPTRREDVVVALEQFGGAASAHRRV